MPVAVEPNPSTSAGVKPASLTARVAACAISPYGVADGTLPTSDSATPAIATRRFTPRPAWLALACARSAFLSTFSMALTGSRSTICSWSGAL